MQSFRERSCFHGNQHCYQQEPYELSRLESYRHHHSQPRQGYNAHSHSAAEPGKECYGQQAYPGYGSASGPAEKQYKGGKITGQQLTGCYGGHLGTPYQYMGEGHTQQKWVEATEIPQYEQDGLCQQEPSDRSSSRGSQYLQQRLQPPSQNQCPPPTQSLIPAYPGHHQQKLSLQDTAPASMTYAQGQLHYRPHPRPLSSSTPTYTEKCTPGMQRYKSYPVPHNSLYSRPIGQSSNLKQSSYGPQNSYIYHQSPSRIGYEQQSQLQGLSNAQDSLPKYRHFAQTHQNYCLSENSVRSPEQYYQNCSPSMTDSPARSVRRSPTYSTTPSPLMVNSENIQYNRSPVTPVVSSPSIVRDQGLLGPQQSHTSPSLNQKPVSYTGTVRDRFSEKLMSNPSLWSLNALTCQVENISNNAQHLLFSETLVHNKNGSKRSNIKEEIDFNGHLNSLEESPSSDTPDVYNTPQSIQRDVEDTGCSTIAEGQLERSYYFCNQTQSTTHPTHNCQLALDMSSPCPIILSSEIATKSEQPVPDLELVQAEENIDTLLKGLDELDKESQQRLNNPTLASPNTSPGDAGEVKGGEESSLLEKSHVQTKEDCCLILAENHCMINHEENKTGKRNEQLSTCTISQTKNTSTQQDEWSDEKYLFDFPETRKLLIGNNTSNDAKLNNCKETKQNCITEGELGVTSVRCKPEMTQSVCSHVRSAEDGVALACRDELHLSHLTCTSGSAEDCLSTDTTEKQEECTNPQPASYSRASKIRIEGEGLLSPGAAVNNRMRMQSVVSCSSVEEKENESQVNTVAETQDTILISPERESVICDTAPLTHTKKTAAFSVFNEEATPLSQGREHIDRRDAAELEPDSPQLPGKSIMHSAPSWANTPPSPKKGDEDIDPEMSCASAVTPSPKSQPTAPSPNLRALNRRQARGRRQQPRVLMHAGAGFRRIPTVKAKEVPAASQKVSMTPHNANVLSGQKDVVTKDVPCQASALLSENIPSRMCTRSFTALDATGVCHHMKRQRGPKPKAFAKKDALGLSKSLIPKIKKKKQRGPKAALLGLRGGRHIMSEIMNQDENKDTSMTLPPLVKDQNPMLLRSKTQTRESPLKEKVAEKKNCLLPKAIKEIKKRETDFLRSESCVDRTQTIASSQQKSVYRALTTNKSDYKSLPATKRKSSPTSMVPVKRLKAMKPSKPNKMPRSLKNESPTVKSTKRKQGDHFDLSLPNFLSQDQTPANPSNFAGLSSQHPAKTKYLPPRKGRGLKYEAMVQKITSVASKKQNPSTLHNGLAILAQRTPPQASQAETTEQEHTAAQSAKVPQHAARVQASDAKPMKPTEEDTCPLDTGTNTGSTVLGVSRLAKQRAIKNNHEMHLKRRRRKQKSPLLPEGDASTGRQEPTVAPAASARAQHDTASTPAAGNTPVCKRGTVKPLSAKKRRAKALGKQCSMGKKTLNNAATCARIKKPLNAVKTEKNGPRLKTRHSKQSVPDKEKRHPGTSQSNLCKPHQTEKLSTFSPYVRTDSSADSPSLCTIINRPEEEHLLFQVRKHNSAKAQSQAPGANAVPTGSAMFQGPMVNRNVAGHLLTCCLCGKPGNHKDLGDLYGPYYAEDSIPRKTQSYQYTQEPREDGITPNTAAVQANCPKRDGPGSKGKGHPGRPRKTERTHWQGGANRPKFLERYKRQYRSHGQGRRAREIGASGVKQTPQGLELEVDIKEHWVHETCAVWTCGIFLVGGKLYGLKEAILAAARMSCSICQEVGATLSCGCTECPRNFHYFCAKDMGCLLQEDSVSVRCTNHQKNVCKEEESQ